MSTKAKYPHCDQRVLHNKNECVFCDAYPEEQQYRIDNKINFTGHNDPDKAMCPADAARGLGQAHRWYGNAPKPTGCTCWMFVDKSSRCPIHDVTYNATCSRCEAPALKLFSTVECSKGCK